MSWNPSMEFILELKRSWATKLDTAFFITTDTTIRDRHYVFTRAVWVFILCCIVALVVLLHVVSRFFFTYLLPHSAPSALRPLLANIVNSTGQYVFSHTLCWSELQSESCLFPFCFFFSSLFFPRSSCVSPPMFCVCVCYQLVHPADGMSHRVWNLPFWCTAGR